MRTLRPLSALVAFGLATSVAAQPAPPPPTPPAQNPCGSMAIQVYEPGCDGPGRLTCDSGVSLPAGSTWCTCDGRTVESNSMAPPTGVRYRFRGPCSATARFELTDERAESGARTGRVVIFLAVASGTSEAARLRGPCRAAPAARGELARITCGAGRAQTAIAARQEGDAIVARNVAPPAAELVRMAIPSGQRVTGAAPRRF